MDPILLEKRSSAITLSDMEIFIFPELLYALVLANLMSPRIWAWRDDPWFAGIRQQGWNRKLQRLKQYVMDHYSFNLDLETWGLTTKPAELARFSPFLDPALLARSNALFGYEGDKYYFDLDIRRHFGLDRYTDDIIPYWKTETVEAMDAFVHKPGHQRGAGECVSLSALYAAALYIVLGVPLEDIFLLATPLHSQNFVAREQGVLTNNRRLVTKTMWFNGTPLSEKARRALEKERVTLVSHVSGYAHIEYPEATISPEHYRRLTAALRDFLTTRVDFEIFANFLRTHAEFRKHFQFEVLRAGRAHYLPAERLYEYEHTSRYRVGDASRVHLLEEVESEDFEPGPLPGRHVLNVLERQLNGHPLHCKADGTCTEFRTWLDGLTEVEALCARLRGFACLTPSLPAAEKTYLASPGVDLPVGLTREEIMSVVAARRKECPTADLAFYAARRIGPEEWEPFVKACLDRNPVSLEHFKTRRPDEVYQALQALPAVSIYGAEGLATPDEVVNFGRGDGLEKAVCLANILRHRPDAPALTLNVGDGRVVLAAGPREYAFTTGRTDRWERELGAKP